MRIGGDESVGVRDGGNRRQQGRRGIEAAGKSEGVSVWDGRIGVWDNRGVWDGSGKNFFLFLLASGKAEVSGPVAASGTVAASLYLWFFPGSIGSNIGVGSAVKW